MGITERKEKEKVDLQKAILAAARAIFLEKGYDNVSIRNIAERIQYSPTTIYLYFKDKDAIFNAIHKEGFALLNEKFQVLQSVANHFERLKAMGRIYIQFANDNPDLYDLMFVQNAPMDCIDEFETWQEGQKAFDGLKFTIQGCIDNGDLKFKDAEIGAFVIWSFMHGMCVLNFKERCKVISEDRQNDIVALSYEAFIHLLDQSK
jgi:AcrR family transcriptional regulator